MLRLNLFTIILIILPTRRIQTKIIIIITITLTIITTTM